MTWRFINTVLTSAGVTVSLTATQNAYVGRDGFVGTSAQTTALNGGDVGQIIQVEGTVAGFIGIGISTNLSVALGESILIAASGVTMGEIAGISMLNADASIVNYGLISGGNGIGLLGKFALDDTRIENSGTIRGLQNGIFNSGNAAVSLINFGTVSGGSMAFVGAGQGDTLRNGGLILGDVDLGGGSDSYDGRGGTVEGVILGGSGNDNFRPGTGIETIDGGDGSDTLNFHTGGAVRVALDDSFASSGAATDDTYTNMENILGSRFGGDLLTGNASENMFDGQGGNDTLSGGAGNDQLSGGTGADRLTGGEGDDQFGFNSITSASDTITDFSNSLGNDDVFVIVTQNFDLSLASGSLLPSQFQSRSDTQAQDADDRFIYNAASHSLWYDGNGNAPGELIRLATLQAGAVVTAADFLLI